MGVGKKTVTATVFAAALCLGVGVESAGSDTEKQNTGGKTEKIKVEEASFKQIKEMMRESDADVNVVHVWATWCPPCRKEFPAIVKTVRAFSEGQLNFILVSADNPTAKEQVLDFLQEYNSPIGSLIADNPQKITESLPGAWSGGIPASFFYDKNGELQKWWAGAHSFSKYKETIRDLSGSE